MGGHIKEGWCNKTSGYLYKNGRSQKCSVVS